VSAALHHIVRGIAAAALLTAAGCHGTGEAAGGTVSAADVDPRSWDRFASLKFEAADTTAHYDLELFVRSNDRFTDDTLTVRIAVFSPDSLYCEEPLRLAIGRPTGAAALAHESVTPYRRRARFARSGVYRLAVTPTRPVAGIEAIGLHLSKSD